MPTYESLPAASEYFKGKVYQRLVEDLRLSGKAKRTVYGDVRAVRKLAEFHQESPETITENEVRQYLLHLIVELEVAAGTQSVILSGLKFFYRTTCPRQWKVLDQTKLNYGNALPEVITQRQVFQIIDNCKRQLANVRWLVWLWRGWNFYLTSQLKPAEEPTDRKPARCEHCHGELRLIYITTVDHRTVWSCEPHLVFGQGRGPPTNDGPAQGHATSSRHCLTGGTA